MQMRKREYTSFHSDVLTVVADRFYREGQEQQKVICETHELANWVQTLKGFLTADEWAEAIEQRQDMKNYIDGILDSPAADAQYFRNLRIANTEGRGT